MGPLLPGAASSVFVDPGQTGDYVLKPRQRAANETHLRLAGVEPVIDAREPAVRLERRAARWEQQQLESQQKHDGIELCEARGEAAIREKRRAKLLGKLEAATNEEALEEIAVLHAQLRSTAEDELRSRAQESLRASEQAFKEAVDELAHMNGEDMACECAERDEEQRTDLAGLTSEQRLTWLTTWIASDTEKWSALRIDAARARDEYGQLRDALHRIRRQARATPWLLAELRAMLPLAGQDDVRSALARVFRVVAKGQQASAREHRSALASLRVAIDQARTSLGKLAGSIWPELRLGRGRPGDVVDLRLRAQLHRWGFTDTEIAEARRRSAALEKLLMPRSVPAARQARRRAARP